MNDELDFIVDDRPWPFPEPTPVPVPWWRRLWERIVGRVEQE